MPNLTENGRVLPLCYRCNHKVTSHAVDDEARAECMEWGCACPAWENAPDGRPIVPADLHRREREALVVLSMLLDLHDPPSEARRRRHAEDEHGWKLNWGEDAP